MELLLCTLGFLWLTSTIVDRVVLQKRHSHKQTEMCASHLPVDTLMQVYCEQAGRFMFGVMESKKINKVCHLFLCATLLFEGISGLLGKQKKQVSYAEILILKSSFKVYVINILTPG